MKIQIAFVQHLSNFQLNVILKLFTRTLGPLNPRTLFKTVNVFGDDSKKSFRFLMPGLPGQVFQCFVIVIDEILPGKRSHCFREIISLSLIPGIICEDNKEFFNQIFLIFIEKICLKRLGKGFRVGKPIGDRKSVV